MKDDTTPATGSGEPVNDRSTTRSNTGEEFLGPVTGARGEKP
jgi:hypothetical protein